MFTKSSRVEALVRVADRIPSMLAYWDSNLRCRFANRAYECWFGVDADALIGTTLQDLLGPELFALNKRYVDGALQGRPQTFERLVPGRDGVQRHSLAHYVPDIVNGAVNGFMVEVTEVTRLKNTEMALRAEIAARERAVELLRKSEAALRRAQHLGQLGSWELESSTGIVSWSEELYRIFGLDPSRLPPAYDEQARLFTDDSWHRLKAAIEHALATGAPYQLEVEYLRQDGVQGWLECRGEVLRDEEGQLVGLQGVAQVTTERRLSHQADLERQDGQRERRLRVELVAQVSVQTRTALNRILGLAELIRRKPSSDARTGWLRMVEDASMEVLRGMSRLERMMASDERAATLTEMGGRGESPDRDAIGNTATVSRENETLAMVVHELRNLLSPVKTGLEVLTFSIGHTEVVDRTLDVLRRQVDYMSRLTSDLLNVSQIKAGAFELILARVSLDEVVQEAIAVSRPLINKARHELIVQLPPSTIWLQVDALRMVQVLSNLLINAAKFTCAPGRIELTAHQEVDAVLISVSDNGIGMPESAMDSSFDLFDQGKHSEAPPPPIAGFGIGLAVVRRLVTLHGGTVWARSAGPGLGSSFVIRLPWVDD